MTTYTRADLATRVLQDLGLIAAEESPSAADRAFAEATIESVFAELAIRRIALPNAADSALPSEYLVSLSKRIGLDLGPSFGLFSIAEAEQAKPITERALREMAALPPTGSVAQAEHF
jgi:hypothetical protein